MSKTKVHILNKAMNQKEGITNEQIRTQRKYNQKLTHLECLALDSNIKNLASSEIREHLKEYSNPQLRQLCKHLRIELPKTTTKIETLFNLIQHYKESSKL